MIKAGNRTVLLLSFILLGLVVAMQFRSVLYKNQAQAANALDVAKLTERLENEKSLEQKLKSEIESLNTNIQSYFKASLEQKKDERQLLEYERLRVKAGLTDVEGPGILLKLDDAPARSEGDAKLLIIHDADIKVVLNDLKIAGAQAISINGERIVPISEVYCAGPNIIINGNKYPVPYIITAIGDPDKLYDYMSKSERLILMQEDKIRVEIKKIDKVQITKYSASDEIEKHIDRLEEIK